MPVQWTPDLAVGHAEIDSQHKELFVKVNDLIEAMREGKGRDEVEKTLAFLEKYVVHHFGTEERLMLRSGYPEYAVHKSQHTELVGDIGVWKTKLESGATLAATIELQRRLTEWLRTHIGRTDKALATFLRTASDAKAPPSGKAQ